jgi:hypothetical protein
MIDLTAQSGSCPDKGNAAYVFKSAKQSAGVPAFGFWNNGTVKCAGGDQAICSTEDSVVKLLTIWSHEHTEAGKSYSFTFDVLNPMVGAGTELPSGQSSPTIYIESSLDGKNTGSESQSTSHDHYRKDEMVKSQDRPCCLCNVEDGDASPLKVKPPMFCKKTIGQSTPYPCQNNSLTGEHLDTPACRILATLLVAYLPICLPVCRLNNMHHTLTWQ